MSVKKPKISSKEKDLKFIEFTEKILKYKASKEKKEKERKGKDKC